MAPRLGKLLAELVVDDHLTAVEIVDCHQLLFIHHQRVSTAEERPTF